MIKYVPRTNNVVLEEIPDRITLAVEISNCRGCCEGCHSPFLKDDIGEELTPSVIEALLKSNFGVNCFLLLGEGQDPDAVLAIAEYMRKAHPGVELALYSGRNEVEDRLFEAFDYVKVGPYIKDRGPLNNPNTNQRLYYHGEDITNKFWRKKA